MRQTHFMREYANRFAVATAAIVAIVGLASLAQADIVYRSASITISNSTYNLDLNGVSVTVFTSARTGGKCGETCGYITTTLSETPAPGNGAIVGPMKLGDELGPGQVYGGGKTLMSSVTAYYYCTFVSCKLWRESFSGSWFGTTGYLGLSFQVNGETYYGWAQLSVGAGAGTLLGYAYETIPGRAIKAGQTSYAWFTPTALNFGTVTDGTSVSRLVTLTNLGPSTLTITNTTLTGSADFDDENGNPPCGGRVAAGATCTLTFSFKPSIGGNETAIYTVFDKSGASDSLQLTGMGKSVEFTPASLHFGTVSRGSTVSGSVTLTNLGSTELLITQAILSGVNKADFTNENSNPPCGGSVPAGATCTLTFSFTPAIVGTERAQYSVYDNGGASPQKLQLTGTGQ